ncbi:MAG: DNA topoisomerase I [archaeon]
MTKKPKKFREEKIAEEYFPVSKNNLRRTIEIPVKESKQNVRQTIEKEYKKPDKRSLEKVEKKFKRKITRKTKALVKKYIPPKIKLKDKSYELIITEKPQAASKIAQALGNPKTKMNKGVAYYELTKEGKKIIVACAVGHLFTLKQEAPGSHVPIFEINWAPNFLVRKNDFTKRYYDTLLMLAQNAGEITVATDFDVEGEVIGKNVIKLICNQPDAQRMKFSTLTKKELNEAYEDKSSHLEWGQEIAGETRHYLDWYYGINLSRALMNAIKTTGKFKIMSIGRVQGPALNLIVKKEKEIKNFESETYWEIFIKTKEPEIELKYVKEIFEKEELKKFEGLIGKNIELSTNKTKQKLPPQSPFNLTNLQTEAYKFYGITPSNTLKSAQSLYLAGLISYPRTSSQKLPNSIDYKSILDKLKIRYKVSKLITKDKPIEGKKTDPAHPSIYPTGEQQILSGYDEKIYDLIVKRFLALFCDDAEINRKKITGIVNDLKFTVSGLEISKPSWLEFYPSKLKQEKLPDANGITQITDQKTEEKQTQPPKRYSQASILSLLEKKNLGTKATRSSILETLYDRGYIKEKSIQATPLGISLIQTLEKYSPIIIDEKLTKELQDKMDDIAKSKKDLEKKKDKVIDKAKTSIINITKDFEKNETKIGQELMGAEIKNREIQKKENTLIQCPKCKKGNLAITYSKRFRRNFIACDAYPECTNTYSLPPKGTIKKTDKLCEKCGFPMMMSLQARRKPWFFCFNKDCETNKERIEKYQEKMEE